MGEGLEQRFREVSSSAEDEDELGESSSLSGESDNEAEDAATSSPNKSSSDSHVDPHGPLHEFSSLVSQLPVKRGLSKFYQGKSQSFSSFSDVRCVEDLAKKETPTRRKMKPSRSYAGRLDDDETHKLNYGPTSRAFSNKGIPKKGPRDTCASSIARTTSGSSYFASGKPPPIPIHRNM